MKLLLLTDCPPCKNLTGGLFLDQLCRFLEPGSVVCFAVTNPELEMKLTPDLDWIPVEYATKPGEAGDYGAPESAFPAHEAESRTRSIEDHKRLNLVPPLIDRAIAFGAQHRVDAVWAVLEGQTMVRMALPVADGLGVPLFSLVWDPLSWWLTANKVDAFNSQLALSQFDETVRRSRSCAVASWAMAEDYEQRYGVPCTALVASHDVSLARTPAPEIRAGSDLVIGMAGQFYASDEWHHLVASLNAQDWRVGDRDIKFLVLGHYLPLSEIPEGRMEFLGWKAQDEAIRLLSERTDVLYCPYPFDPKMEEVARFSFPSKLPLYFAAGRPVIFHGPSYSSPGRYIERRSAGLLCLSPEGSCVVDHLEHLASDPDLFRLAATKSQEAFRRDFTLQSKEASFRTFLEGNDHKRDRLQQGAAAESDVGELEPAEVPPGSDSGLLTLERFQRSAGSLRRERDQLAALVAAAHDEKRTALAIRDSLSLHIRTLEALQTEARSENERLRAELVQLRREASEATRHRDALRLEVLSLSQQHEEVLKRQLMRQRSKLERERDELAQELSFISRLRALELVEKEGLEAQVRSYISERDAISKARDELERKYSKVLDAKAGLEQQVTFYKGQIAELSANSTQSAPTSQPLETGRGPRGAGNGGSWNDDRSEKAATRENNNPNGEPADRSEKAATTRENNSPNGEPAALTVE